MQHQFDSFAHACTFLFGDTRSQFFLPKFLTFSYSAFISKTENAVWGQIKTQIWEYTQIWSPILVHQYFETVFWYCFTIQASISNSDTVSRNICEGEVDWGTRFWSCLHIVLIVWSFWSSREDACQAHRKRLIGTAEEYIYEDWVLSRSYFCGLWRRLALKRCILSPVESTHCDRAPGSRVERKEWEVEFESDLLQSG